MVQVYGADWTVMFDLKLMTPIGSSKSSKKTLEHCIYSLEKLHL